MTEKITIRRRADGWHVTRPPFGFGPATTAVYPTGRAALGSLTRQGLASANAVTQATDFTLYQHHRPRWIGASGGDR